MGAIELQVFVSLVVILGAAFVALICDFLKGNNEQLRESNIEMRVRQDEREKRAEILDKVQRHTIDALVQARVAPAAVAAAAPCIAAQPPADAQAQQFREAALAGPDTRESFERTQQERSVRRREGRRQQPPSHAVTEAPAAETGQVSSWADSIDLKRHPQSVAAPVTVEVQPAVAFRPMVPAPVAPFAAQLPAASPASLLFAGSPAAPQMVNTLEAVPLPVGIVQPKVFHVVPTDVSVTGGSFLPEAGLSLETPIYDIVEAASPAAPEVTTGSAAGEQLTELDSPVVRIRVLSENELLQVGEPFELALPMDGPVLPSPVGSLQSPMPVATIEPIVVALPLELPLPVGEIEAQGSSRNNPLANARGWNGYSITDPNVSAGTLEQPVSIAEIEPVNRFSQQEWPRLTAAVAPIVPAELPAPALPVAVIETTFFAQPLGPSVAGVEESFAIMDQTARAELRSNVVEMPATPVVRNIEPAQPDLAELVIPGGFHEAPVLARLLEEETPFNGLALVVSVVDYIRLMADQGKPAAEQLMGSISRLVLSLAREQDFACRIAEDEFVLLFGHETGAAAKRRIQLVSERLWDFQLRSLGTVSVIFSWGVSESTNEPVVHAVGCAREQMLESRRNRRALAFGIGRFRLRVANS